MQSRSNTGSTVLLTGSASTVDAVPKHATPSARTRKRRIAQPSPASRTSSTVTSKSFGGQIVSCSGAELHAASTNASSALMPGLCTEPR